MQPATMEFLRQRFSDYYSGFTFDEPSEIRQREWGFVFFEQSGDIRMKRHVGFTSGNEARDYIKMLTPAHVYYSSAYYKRPDAPTMKEKDWMGADLIFDLDADHIVRGDYAMMLDRVHQETQKLLDMITDELGFSKKDISIVFSGGRGYHVHIFDPEVRLWGSQERREIIDYLCGIGIDVFRVLGHDHSTDKGWNLRIRQAIIKYINELESLPPDEAAALISGNEGIGKKAATEFMKEAQGYKNLMKGAGKEITGKKILQKIIENDKRFLEILRAEGTYPDEPVTTDIKRLIRLPSSLHGGSGMRVTRLSFEQFSDFNPLEDAVVFGDREIAICLGMDLKMSMMGNVYTLQKGENHVPEALAVFLCCRGLAELSGV
jgi:DNA primase small subunit